MGGVGTLRAALFLWPLDRPTAGQHNAYAMLGDIYRRISDGREFVVVGRGDETNRDPYWVLVNDETDDQIDPSDNELANPRLWELIGSAA